MEKKLFNNKIIGINVSDFSLEVAELEKVKGQVKISSLGRVTLPENVILNGRIKDPVNLAKIFQNCFVGARPRPITAGKAIFCLAEKWIYAKYFSLSDGEHDLAYQARHEAEANFPIKAEDLALAWKEIIVSPKSQRKILVIGTDQKLLNEWEDFLASLGLRLEQFDLETFSSVRALCQDDLRSPYGIIDIGQKVTIYTFFSSRGFADSYIANIGGRDISAFFALILKTDLAQAQKIKEEKGLPALLSAGLATGGVALDRIINEAQKGLENFRNEQKEEIKGIILIGGNSKIPGLLEFVKQRLTGIHIAAGRIMASEEEADILFATSIGSAWRYFFKSTDPFFPPFFSSLGGDWVKKIAGWNEIKK